VEAIWTAAALKRWWGERPRSKPAKGKRKKRK